MKLIKKFLLKNQYIIHLLYFLRFLEGRNYLKF